MVQARDDFEKPAYVELIFGDTIRKKYDNSRHTVMRSVEIIAETVRFELDEISEDNRFNGSIIKEGMRMQRYEEALIPVFTATENLFRATERNKGFSSDFEVTHQASGKTEEVDLIAVEYLLVNAVNRWILAVSIDEHEEMSHPTLPLAINDEARENPELGIVRIKDIMLQTADGWEPKEFLSNRDASDILARVEASTRELSEQLVVT